MALKTTLIPYEALRTFVTTILIRLGLPGADAEVEANCLLKANLRGFETHGVARIPAYAKCLLEGRINPRPQIKIEQHLPWAYSVVGDNGMGHLVASRGMETALLAAERIGIGVAVVRQTNHIGAACVYSLMAIERNCIGLVLANASPTVAPWGSRESFLGSNPISVAIPAGRHAPFVMDMATSTVARRKIRDALQEGRAIPVGWALDADGHPTSDPAAALAGTLMPMADAKGSALGLMIDILAGVLSGAEFGGQVLSFLTNVDREANSGNFLLALKIDTFMQVPDFLARMDDLIDRVHALQPTQEGEKVRIPGERGADLEAERRRMGIPFNSRDQENLCRLGDSLGVSFPAM